MRICLAGTASAFGSQDYGLVSQSPYLLESFYYIKPWQFPLIHECDLFLLDSGAFTFFSSGRHVDWQDYLQRYARFVNEQDVEHFFELDIDALVGYDMVLEMRKYLERETQRKCVPVWHANRGKEDYLRMCDAYDYVAIGGLVSKEMTQKMQRSFPWFIDRAHASGAKIHGLGFVKQDKLPMYHFDSVDCTSWCSGRFSRTYIFTGDKVKGVYANTRGKRIKSIDAVNKTSFQEWIKFQKYAEVHL